MKLCNKSRDHKIISIIVMHLAVVIFIFFSNIFDKLSTLIYLLSSIMIEPIIRISR